MFFLSTFVKNVRHRLFHTTVRLQKVVGPSGQHPPEHPGKFKLFRTLSLFIGIPLIGAQLFNVMSHHESEEVQKEKRPPFHKYEHMRRRTKRFPWGDGTKSLFHNPLLNPLPDGYEDDDDECDD